MRRIFLTLFLIAGFVSATWSADVYWNSRLEGNAVSGGVISMEDGDYNQLGTGAFVDINPLSYLRLGLTERVGMDFLQYDTRVRVTVKVIPYQSGIAQSPVTQILEVIYSPSGASGITVDAEDYRMTNVYKFTAEVTAITVDQLQSGNWVTTNSIPSFLYLEAGFAAERYYQLNENFVPTVQTSFIQYSNGGSETVVLNTSPWVVTTATTNEIEISWNYVPGAEEYDLEWTWVDNYDQLSTGISLTEDEFQRNSSRIRIGAQSYRLPQTYAKGFLIYRVRAVGRWLQNTTKDKYGAWSSGTASKYFVSDWPNVIEIGVEHEKGKNWFYEVNYLEDGKRNEEIIYLDGTFKTRQTIQRYNSNNKTEVSEKIYDTQGREAIEVMPAPQNNASLNYYNYLNNDVDGRPYSHLDFDWESSSDNCVMSRPKEMDNTSGASQYFSSTSLENNWQKNVPDAEKYPFMQIQYAADNTGRIVSKGGVGYTHGIGGGHETMYYYSQPSQEELNRLFGYKVGYKSRYKKNMTVDPNGQISVAYLDADDRIIATATAGDNNTGLSTLPDMPSTSSALSTDLLNKILPTDEDTPLDDNKLESTGRFGALNDALTVGTQLNVVQDQTLYQLNYGVTTSVYHEVGCEGDPGVSYPYVYDLIISVKDNCGDEKYTQTYTKIGVEQIGGLTGVALNEAQNDLYLDQGTYTVYKELRVNEEALNNYLANYLSADGNPCLENEESFTLPVESDCDQTCEECVEALGTQLEFLTARAKEIYGSNATHQNLTNAEHVMFDQMYEEAKAVCIEPCTLLTNCESYHAALINDVMPNGQYGSLNGTDLLSVFTPSNQLGVNWRSLTYTNEDGSQAYIQVEDDGNGGYLPACISGATITTIDGDLFVTPNGLLNTTDLASFFQPQWAELLLPYHPEYKLYQYSVEICNNKYAVPTTGESPQSTLNLSSDEFDAYLRDRVFTIADAKGEGAGLYINTSNYFINLVSSTSTVNQLIQLDPYFQLTYSNIHTLAVSGFPNIDNTTRKLQLMQEAMGNYQNSGMSMFEYAVRSVTGGYSFSGPLNTAYDTWQDVLDNTNTALSQTQKDQVWNNFKSYYISEKGRINQLLMDMYGFAQQPGIYNGSIGSGNLSEGIALSFTSSQYFTSIHHDIILKLWKLSFGFPFNFGFQNLPDIYTGSVYDGKQIRITRIDALTNNTSSASSQLQDLSDQANYAMWQSTGLSPNANGLQTFLHALATTNRLNQTTGWNSVPEFTPALFTEITGINMSASAGNAISFSGSASLNSLTLNIINNSQTICNVQFPQVGSLHWTDYNVPGANEWHIYQLGNVYPTSASTMQVLIKAGATEASAQEYVVTLSTSCVDLTYQSNAYANDNSLDADCGKKSAFEASMLQLLQALALNNQLSSTVSLNTITAYTSGILPDYFGPNAIWEGAYPRITDLAHSFYFKMNTTIPSNVVMVNGFNFGTGDAFEISYSNIDNNLPNTTTVSGSYSYLVSESKLSLDFTCSCEELNGTVSTTTFQGSQADYDNKLKAFFNHLFELASTGNIPPIGYHCPELDALAVYFGGTVLFNPLYTLSSGYCYRRLPTNGSYVHGSGTTYRPMIGSTYAIGFSLTNPRKQTCEISFPYSMNYEEMHVACKLKVVSLTSSGSSFTVALGNAEDDTYLQQLSAIHYTGTSSCEPDFDVIVTEPEPCEECTPTAQAPVSCTDAYTAYVDYMENMHKGDDTYASAQAAALLQNPPVILTPELYANMTQDHFCDLVYAYISQAYLHYLTVFGITNTVTDPRFLTMAEFGTTPIGYSNSDLITAVNAYHTYIQNNGTLGWNDYVSQVYAVVNAPLCPKIAPNPTIPTPTTEVPPCNEWGQNIALVNAQNQWGIYLNQVADEFRLHYIEGAMSSVVETFTESHADKEFHYTLYYFDRAGNLIQTVPPKGVDRMELTTPQNTAINQKRLNDPTAVADQVGYAPQHTLTTDYRYNSLNFLVYQSTPDAGKMWFAYDYLGRVVVSQNSKQRAAHVLDQNGMPRQQFSYTLYDELGRTAEVGQFTDDIGLSINEIGQLVYISDPNQLFDVNTLNWINNTSLQRTEVTSTIYDELKIKYNGALVDLQVQMNSGLQNVASQFSDYKINNARDNITASLYQDVYNVNKNVYVSGIFYNYDNHGNIIELLKINNDPILIGLNENVKHFDYQYDLLSGNITKSYFQRGKKDQFIHQYSYDADDRITHVETSKDDFVFEKDAKYFYYDHGVIARTEIGEKKVQAEDYAYTIHGWLKAINGEQLSEQTMMGADGAVTGLASVNNVNQQIARDAYGFSLNYYQNDYKSADMSMLNYSLTSTTLGTQLFNGNIRSVYTAISNTKENLSGPVMNTHHTAYEYDQLNRLLAMQGYWTSLSGNTITESVSEYSSSYNYDLDGNLTGLTNRSYKLTDPANTSSALTAGDMDNLHYYYYRKSGAVYDPADPLAIDDPVDPTDDFTHRLAYVSDEIADNHFDVNDADDIDNQLEGNFSYDQIGQLTKDVSEGIIQIDWTLSNKIKAIKYGSGRKIEFNYDPAGFRISKKVTEVGGDYASSFYSLDAQGNLIATYEYSGNIVNQTYNPASYQLAELFIHGDERIGIEKPNDHILVNNISNPNIYENKIGDKYYELVNHLGSVINVVTDRKLPIENTLAMNSVGHYVADVVMYSDYYPYGQELPHRHDGSSDYKYGYQGSEKDNEIKGQGNSYTTFHRALDPRLGVWLSPDPEESERSWQSPFLTMDNNPIMNSDPDGDIIPIILGIWAVAEVCMTAYDAYDTYKTVSDPKATKTQKAVAVAGFVSGLALPGGGYGTAGKQVVKQVEKKVVKEVVETGTKKVATSTAKKTATTTVKKTTTNATKTVTKETAQAGASKAKTQATKSTKATTPAKSSGGSVGGSSGKSTGNTKTYQTYTKQPKNPETHGVYSGRTSGTGTAKDNIAKRDANHHMNDTHHPAVLDKSSPNSNAIRGREQQLINKNGGAKSTGGKSGNAINGVGPNNKKASTYNNAANKEFGKIK